MIKKCILIIVQRDTTQSNLFIILQVHSTYFGCQLHPSSGVHKTVTIVSGTGHIFCAATFLQLGQAWEVTAQKIWPVPEAVVTVLCTPDDGCGLHPKYVEWTCRIINRLLYAASHWTIINIDQRCTEPKHKRNVLFFRIPTIHHGEKVSVWDLYYSFTIL